MEQVVYIICCLLTLLADAWSCPVRCICHNVTFETQAGVDVDCSYLYLEDLPSIPGNAVKLDFSSNRLEQIPNRIKLSTELRELDVSDNRLGLNYGIADNLFSTLVNLKVLNLSENYISTFSPNSFNGLPRLEKLDLHGNIISQLPLGMLQSLSTTIIVVCLGGNPWNCNRCEFRETLMGYLSYEQNDLATFCNREVPTCSSESVEKTFTEVSLEEIPECFEEKPTTTSCPVHCICHNVAFKNQTGVDVDCSKLYFEYLPSIPGNAVKLDFSSNRLEQIPNRIKLSTELRELDLSDNLLGLNYRIADNLFSTLVNLKVLNLSDNYISTFSLNSFNGLSRLEKLDLHENYISQLPPGMLQSLSTTIVVVCLGDNPWNCNRCGFRETLMGYLSYEQNDLTTFCNREVPTCSLETLERTFTEVSLEEIPACSEEEKTITTSARTFISTTFDSSTELSTVTKDSSILNVGEKPHTTIFAIPEYDNPKESIVEATSEEGIGFPSNRLLSGDDETKRDNQIFIAAAIVILGVMLLTIFLVFSIILWKMQRNPKKDTIFNKTPSTDPFLVVSPWPLLQGKQPPVTEEPDDITSSQLTVYEEIPCSQGENFDGYVTSKDMSKTQSEQTNGQPGAATKGFELYSVKIDNPYNTILHNQSNVTMEKLSQAGGNESIAVKCKSSDISEVTELSESAPYMEMRSPIGEVGVKDLYAPLDT